MSFGVRCTARRHRASGETGSSATSLNESGAWGRAAPASRTLIRSLGAQGQDYAQRQDGWWTKTLPLFPASYLPHEINHFRVWQQPLTGADFISASYEQATFKQTPDFLRGARQEPTPCRQYLSAGGVGRGLTSQRPPPITAGRLVRFLRDSVGGAS